MDRLTTLIHFTMQLQVGIAAMNAQGHVGVYSDWRQLERTVTYFIEKPYRDVLLYGLVAGNMLVLYV